MNAASQKYELESPPFVEVTGKTQNYSKGEVKWFDTRIEFYIYDDEAGIRVGSDWLICEIADYPDEAARLNAYKNLIEKRIAYLKNPELLKIEKTRIQKAVILNWIVLLIVLTGLGFFCHFVMKRM